MLGAGIAVAAVLAVTIGVLVVNAGEDSEREDVAGVLIEPVPSPTTAPMRAPSPSPTAPPTATAEPEVVASATEPTVNVITDEPSQAADAAPPPTSTPVPLAAPPPPPPPAPTGSLAGQRVYANGDSTSYFMSVGVLSSAVAMGGLQVQPAPEYQVSAGLLNSNFFDWYGYLASDMATYNPGIVVFMIGANDAHVGMDLRSYAERVGQLMDLLNGRRVIWAGQPNMGRADLAAAIPAMNEVFSAEAAKRPWVRYVDTWSLTSDANGNFTPYLPDGTLARGSDGVHFTSAGGAYLAQAVVAAIVSSSRGAQAGAEALRPEDLASTPLPPERQVGWINPPGVRRPASTVRG